MLMFKPVGMRGFGAVNTEINDYCERLYPNSIGDQATCMETFGGYGPKPPTPVVPGGGSGSGGGGGGGSAFSLFSLPNLFAPTTPMYPGMPMPGMPGYVPPTPWYAGPMGILLLAIGGFAAYKLLSK